MSVTPHNVFSSSLARSVGRSILAYTCKGLVVEGYLGEVDSADNILLKDGYVYWFLNTESYRYSFKKLVIKGADLACFIARPNQTTTQREFDTLPRPTISEDSD